MTAQTPFIERWWPSRKIARARTNPDEEVALKYGHAPHLVDLQPFILRWGVMWVVVTLLYSLATWLPLGPVRTAFVAIIVVLWIASGSLMVSLLVMQKRRREDAAERAVDAAGKINESEDAQ